MLTNNFYTYMRVALAFPPSNWANSSALTFPLSFIDTRGKSNNASASGAYYWDGDNALDLSRCTLSRRGASTSFPACVWFGSGANAATKNDYTLQSPIADSVATIGVSDSDGGEDSNGHSFSELTIRIIASTAITISEVGYLLNIFGGSSLDFFTYADATTGQGAGILIDRTVLDSPLTLKAGDVGFIKYRITNETEYPE